MSWHKSQPTATVLKTTARVRARGLPRSFARALHDSDKPPSQLLSPSIFRDVDGVEDVEVDQVTKTVKTAVGPLPLSPVMDESFHAARTRWEQPKKAPYKAGEHQVLKFRKKILRNPFGTCFTCFPWEKPSNL
jgi:hypothetical protein